MAFESIWYFTDLPTNVVDIIEEDLKNEYDPQLSQSEIYGRTVDISKRNSENTWIPSSHWIAGFLWHYVQRANRENFLYDLRNIDGENLQYTRYEVGQFYKWHCDSGLRVHYKPQSASNLDVSNISQDFTQKNCELVRKLSFSLQLSDSDDYEGGNVQFIDENEKSFFAPRKKGTIVLFDSRIRHRVLKVKSGVRKSIVGWVVGPRWK